MCAGCERNRERHAAMEAEIASMLAARREEVAQATQRIMDNPPSEYGWSHFQQTIDRIARNIQERRPMSKKAAREEAKKLFFAVRSTNRRVASKPRRRKRVHPELSVRDAVENFVEQRLQTKRAERILRKSADAKTTTAKTAKSKGRK